MQITTKTLNFRRLLDIDNYAHLICDIVLSGQVLDTVLFGLKPILEYAFGMCIGYVVGWLFGLYLGQSYVEYFTPAYLVDLGQLSYWRFLPYGFARTGAITAAIMGAVAVMIINNRLLNERIVSMHKNGKTDPRKIAHALGQPQALIERKMGELLG